MQPAAINGNHARTNGILALVLILIVAAGCEESSVPTGPQTSVNADNGFFPLEVPQLLIHDVHSSSDGYVYVCGEKIGSNEGWLGRFTPDGTLDFGWDYTQIVTGVLPFSRDRVAAMMSGGQTIMIVEEDEAWTSEDSGTLGVVRNDGSFVLADYADGGASVRIHAHRLDGTMIWDITEPVGNALVAMAVDPTNRVGLLVYRPLVGNPGRGLNLLIVEADGSAISSVELIEPGIELGQNSLSASEEGTWIVVGTTYFETEYQLIAIEYNETGRDKWIRVHEHPTGSAGSAIAYSRNGTVVAVGVENADNEYNALLVRLQFDEIREKIEERNYGDASHNNICREMILLLDGRMQIIGETLDSGLYIERDPL